jgi:hypothetical protein
MTQCAIRVPGQEAKTMTTEARGLAGQIHFDGQFITIERRGFFPWLFHGSSGTKSIPIKAVTAVQHRRCGLYKGYLQLSIQGEQESHGGRSSVAQNLDRDENTIVFYYVANRAFDAMAETLRTAVADAQSGRVAPTAGEAMKQIEDLGKLRDSGFITEADFERKKNDLLGRI